MFIGIPCRAIQTPKRDSKGDTLLSNEDTDATKDGVRQVGLKGGEGGRAP